MHHSGTLELVEKVKIKQIPNLSKVQVSLDVFDAHA